MLIQGNGSRIWLDTFHEQIKHSLKEAECTVQDASTSLKVCEQHKIENDKNKNHSLSCLQTSVKGVTPVSYNQKTSKSSGFLKTVSKRYLELQLLVLASTKLTFQVINGQTNPTY